MIEGSADIFLLRISVIDLNNPFFFDVAIFSRAQELFGENIILKVEYCDLAQNRYIYEAPVEIMGSLPPTIIGNDNFAKMVKALESIEKTLSKLNVSRESVVKPSFLLPKQPEIIFPTIEKLIPDLLTEMRNDLREYPFVREFIIINKIESEAYCANPNNPVLQYYFEAHPYLRNKLRILENYALIYEITYNSVDRFVICEELAAYLTDEFSNQ